MGLGVAEEVSGRHYERFADHAVSVARRVVYLVTGEAPERRIDLASVTRDN